MTQTKGSKQQLPEQKKPLSAEAVAARRKYYREYNRKNADKRKAWNNAHWEKVAAAQNTEERQED